MKAEDLETLHTRITEDVKELNSKAHALWADATDEEIVAPTAHTIISNLNSTLWSMVAIAHDLPDALTRSLLDPDITVTDSKGDPVRSVKEASAHLYEAREALSTASEHLNHALDALGGQTFVTSPSSRQIPETALELLIATVDEGPYRLQVLETLSDNAPKVRLLEPLIARLSASLQVTLTRSVDPEDELDLITDKAVEAWQDLGQILNRNIPPHQLYQMWREANYPVSFDQINDGRAVERIESSMIAYLRAQVNPEQLAADIHANTAEQPHSSPSARDPAVEQLYQENHQAAIRIDNGTLTRDP